MPKIIEHYLNLKFDKKLLISFFVIIFITICLISSADFLVSNFLITRYASDYSTAISSQIAANFYSRITNIEETNFIKYQNNRAFNELPTFSDSTPIQEKLLYQSALDDLLYSVDYYKSICFIDKNNNIYSSGPSPFQLADSLSPKQESDFIRRAWGKCIWAYGPSGELFLKRALYHQQSGNYIGSLIVEIDKTWLSDVYASSISSYGGSVVVLDSSYTPVLFENQAYADIAIRALADNAPSIKHNGETYITSIAATLDKHWILIHTIPLSQLTKGLFVIGYCIIAISILVLSLAIFLAYLISNNISQNLKLLLSSMNQVSQGQFNKRIIPVSRDEFGTIIDHFNIMIEKIKTLMDQVALEQKQKQQVKYQMLEFQYNTLQAQLHPHFLYNVLDSISSLAQLKDETEISEWICLLSDMLRESIGQKQRFVPLETELSYVKKYTTLYQMMYKDRVTIRYKICADLNSISVPAFILQPVVENSIVHGIEQISDAGIIIIRAYSKENTLILEVQDNGHGIPQETVNEILSFTASSPESKHRKVGLSSVLERIRLLYGADYGIQIDTGRDRGTTVKILLPLNQ